MTADRPIAECLGSGQRELNASGTVRRAVGPAYSSAEQDRRDELARQTGIVEAARAEDRRRESALISRYPTARSHDSERNEALSQIDAILRAARLHLETLSAERHRLDSELEFYGKDPLKAPVSLRLQVAENSQSVAAQNRFIGQQEEDRRRVEARFDKERAQLVRLWTAAVP